MIGKFKFVFLRVDLVSKYTGGWVDAKSTPSYSSDIHSRYSKIDPIEGRSYVLKYVGKSPKIKKGRQWYMPDKKRSTIQRLTSS